MDGVHSAAHALYSLLPVFIRAKRTDACAQCKTSATTIKTVYRYGYSGQIRAGAWAMVQIRTSAWARVPSLIGALALVRPMQPGHLRLVRRRLGRHEQGVRHGGGVA